MCSTITFVLVHLRYDKTTILWENKIEKVVEEYLETKETKLVKCEAKETLRPLVNQKQRKHEGVWSTAKQRKRRCRWANAKQRKRRCRLATAKQGWWCCTSWKFKQLKRYTIYNLQRGVWHSHFIDPKPNEVLKEVSALFFYSPLRRTYLIIDLITS